MNNGNGPRRKIEGERMDEGMDGATAPPARTSGTRLVRARREGADGGTGLGPIPPELAPECTVEEIYRACRGRVFGRFAFLGVPRADAMDLTHDVFVTLFEQREQGTVARDVSAMLGKLTLRRFWNYARAQSTGRRRDGGALTDVELPALRIDPEESTYGEELRRMVHQILARMPESQAQLIRLVDLDGMSHEEVAAGLGCTLNALRVLLHRARSAFNKIAEIDLGEDLEGVR